MHLYWKFYSCTCFCTFLLIMNSNGHKKFKHKTKLLLCSAVTCCCFFLQKHGCPHSTHQAADQLLMLTTSMTVAINTNAGAQKIVQKCHGGGTPVGKSIILKLLYVTCTVMGDACKRFNELFSTVLCCHWWLCTYNTAQQQKLLFMTAWAHSVILNRISGSFI